MLIKNFVINASGIEDLAEWMMQPVIGIDELIITTENILMEDLAVQSGMFPSKGQARKNGFVGEVPTGFWWLGTKKIRFWVWNPVKNDAAPPNQFVHKVKASINGNTVEI